MDLNTQQMLVLSKLDSLNSALNMSNCLRHEAFAAISLIKLDVEDVAFVFAEDHIYLLKLLTYFHSFRHVCSNVSKLLPVTHSSCKIANTAKILIAVLEFLDE